MFPETEKENHSKRPRGLDDPLDLLPEDTSLVMDTGNIAEATYLQRPYTFKILQISRKIKACIFPEYMLSVRFG